MLCHLNPVLRLVGDLRDRRALKDAEAAVRSIEKSSGFWSGLMLLLSSGRSNAAPARRSETRVKKELRNVITEIIETIFFGSSQRSLSTIIDTEAVLVEQLAKQAHLNDQMDSDYVYVFLPQEPSSKNGVEAWPRWANQDWFEFDAVLKYYTRGIPMLNMNVHLFQELHETRLEILDIQTSTCFLQISSVYLGCGIMLQYVSEDLPQRSRLSNVKREKTAQWITWVKSSNPLEFAVETRSRESGKAVDSLLNEQDQWTVRDWRVEHKFQRRQENSSSEEVSSRRPCQTSKNLRK